MSLEARHNDPDGIGPGKDIFAHHSLVGAAAGLVVFALACGVHALTGEFGRPPTLWPANGVILACLIRSRPGQWPALLIGGLVGNLAANLLIVDQISISLAIQLCNTGEILFCAAGLRRVLGPRFDLNRLGHILTFALLALVGSGLASLAAGAISTLLGWSASWRTALLWTLSDALGLMILTPPLLTLNRAGWAQFIARKALARNLGLMVLLVATTILVFLRPEFHLRTLVLAALVLMAFQAGATGAALGLLTVSLVVTVIAASGLGSHLGDSNSDSQLFLQVFLLAGVATVFPVAASVARRRNLEVSLAARAHDFQMLVDHSTDLIVRFDRDFTLLYASPACAQFGYSQEELVGRSGLDFVHSEEVEGLSGLLRALIAGRPLAPDEALEYRIRTAAGDWVWVEGRPQTVAQEGGQVAEIVTMLRNVTERKAAEAALADSEARYRMLAEKARDIIIHTDTQGIVRYASPSVRRLGYEPEDVIGQQVWDSIHPEDVAPTKEKTERMWNGEILAKTELNERRVRRADGGWVWLEGAPTAVRDETGKVTGIVNSFRDVTARKALEDELERKRAEAEAAVIAKSEFLANMSHEIRTPLTAIIGFAGVLDKAGDLSEEAQFCASRIVTAGHALLTVVNDILDFSKIEAGQVDLDPQPFDPAAFVEETVQLVQAQAAAKDLSVYVRQAGELPAAVSADSSRLRQILLNLLTNAIKFTASGEVVVEASFEAGDGGVLRLTVSDTGAGIAPDHLDRLFQRFSQADGSITRRYGGTGLGLAICKNLTELMGGAIAVESAEGRGSTFRFSIAAPPAEPPVRAAEAAGVVVAADEEPARILVVDDVTANREVVRALLGVFGHELVEASGGAQAVDCAMDEAFDLILMDLQMPGMDGLSATRAIRATPGLNQKTPIVALSADVLDLHREACREAGMNDHIGKPINPTELLTKVAQWCATGVQDEPKAAEAL